MLTITLSFQQVIIPDHRAPQQQINEKAKRVTKMWQRLKVSKHCWKNGAQRLVQSRVATDLQLAKTHLWSAIKRSKRKQGMPMLCILFYSFLHLSLLIIPSYLVSLFCSLLLFKRNTNSFPSLLYICSLISFFFNNKYIYGY